MIYLYFRKIFRMNQAIKIYASITIATVAVVLIFYSYSVKTSQNEELDVFPASEWVNKQDSILNNTVLFDIHLKYLLNSNVCSNSSNILAVIVVTSYLGNIETRSAMRRAFRQDQLSLLGFKRVFLLGTAPKDKFTSQHAIDDESEKFGDLIQGNFIEAYRNLTYKHMMGLRWAVQFCSKAKYIIKMDDDIVVNIVEFANLLTTTLKLPENSFAGYVLRGLQPKREPHNKWYVTKDEFAGNYYPTFVSGWFYVTSPKTLMKILYAQPRSELKYFWIDDLFVTGILAQEFRVRHFDIGRFFAVHSEFMQCCVSDIKKDNLKCEFLIGPNGGDSNLFYTFNKAVEMCTNNPCHTRTKPMNETCVAEKRVSLGKGNAVVSNYKLH